MRQIRWFRVFLMLGLLLGLMGLGPQVMAQPPDPEDNPAPEALPPGIGLREFIHYPKGVGGRPGQIVEPLCSDPTTNNTANCDSFSYSGIHWANPSGIPYYVNLNFSTKKSPTLTKAAALSAIQASLATWQGNNTSGKLSYTYQGATSVKSSRLDGVNAVLWGGTSGAIAITRVWYNTTTKEIVEFDILLGNSLPWSYTPPQVADCSGSADYPYCDPANSGVAGTYDVRNITTHEAGHTLLLEDLYDATDGDLTMYGYGATAELKKDTLGYGDWLGLNRIYP